MTGAWNRLVLYATQGRTGLAPTMGYDQVIIDADAELQAFRAAQEEAAKCNDKGCGWMDGHSLCKNCTDALRLLRQVRK